MDEIDEAEEVRIMIYTRKKITWFAILEGHVSCAEYLNNSVKELAENGFVLDWLATDTLQEELRENFMEEGDEKLLARPDKEEVWQAIKSFNLHTGPGKDSITNFLYYKHFGIIRNALT